VVSVSETALSGFNYNYYSGTSSPVKSFMVWGAPLAGDIAITAPTNYEISLSTDNGYVASLVINNSNGVVNPTTIYLRLKSGLSENAYTGNISVVSTTATSKTIALSGYVSWSRVYDFTNDVATTTAASGTVPALNMTIGTGNTTTAGVVSYTDANNATSNRFRPYTGGNRNATGIVNLNLFPTNASDYSVTWKQSVGSASTDYKVGVLLRGNSPVGDASTGYVQGMMNGYVFIAYTAGGAATPHSEFRIYRSTSATSLNVLVNLTVNGLIPTVGQSVWYRASATGSTSVNLKLEYSTDSINWNIGATATDASTVFTSGATQLVYGLGSGNYNFYVDDIAFSTTLGILPVSLTAFNAKVEGSNVRLNWNTIAETNNVGFDVERSADGRNFNKIGYVSGSRISSTIKYYELTDYSPLSGISYYRLRQIDANGNFSYSEVRMVSMSGTGSPVTIYPNPASNKITINLGLDWQAGDNVTIYNIDGRAVISKPLTQSIESINISTLPAGTYLLTVSNKELQKVRQKIIKN